MENSSRKTIMVVDDNPVTRATIETLLEDRYNILNAENGADCLMQVEG